MADRTTFWKTATYTLAVLLEQNSAAHSSVGAQAVDELLQRGKFTQLESDSKPQTNGEMKETPAVQENGQPGLPNGADALRESFGDWAVECKIVGTARACSMGLFQEDAKTRKKIIAMVISPPENGSTRIMILMPFGLALADGIRLKLDNRPTDHLAQFATCIPDGCLVLIAFSNASMETLKQAKTLTITATLYGSATGPAFTISLKGLAAAHARLMGLRREGRNE